jgi:hypothetical protein
MSRGRVRRTLAGTVTCEPATHESKQMVFKKCLRASTHGQLARGRRSLVRNVRAGLVILGERGARQREQGEKNEDQPGHLCGRSAAVLGAERKEGCGRE